MHCVVQCSHFSAKSQFKCNLFCCDFWGDFEVRENGLKPNWYITCMCTHIYVYDMPMEFIVFFWSFVAPAGGFIAIINVYVVCSLIFIFFLSLLLSISAPLSLTFSHVIFFIVYYSYWVDYTKHLTTTVHLTFFFVSTMCVIRHYVALQKNGYFNFSV